MGSHFASRSDYKCFEKKGLHFIHVNTRNRLPKIDELRIRARETNAACLRITETWLDDTIFDSEILIDNAMTETVRAVVCVCMYIRRDLAFNALDELYHDDIDATWIELLLPKSKPIVSGVVHKHVPSFYKMLESVCLDRSLFNERAWHFINENGSSWF